jgi:hypothetical protein
MITEYQAHARKIEDAVQTVRDAFQRTTGVRPVFVYLGSSERDMLSMAYGSAPIEILGLRVVPVAVQMWVKVGI